MRSPSAFDEWREKKTNTKILHTLLCQVWKNSPYTDKEVRSAIYDVIVRMKRAFFGPNNSLYNKEHLNSSELPFLS